MTLLPICKDVETQMGVPVTVTAVAQVMVMAEDHMSGVSCRLSSFGCATITILERAGLGLGQSAD